ncbi:MAG: type II toxin-antitoxin system VapC family toxin [Euryarchaeota archaeon]|nr:type II toxin-antitoxin system VapC family toxin [Euryarchaeota archaeon]
MQYRKELDKIEGIFKTSFNISIIAEIEFLGWRGHTEKGFEEAKEFIGFANVIILTDEIADLAVSIGRKAKVKLPDAVIAATALHGNLMLITRNENDFKDIEELRIYNPFR